MRKPCSVYLLGTVSVAGKAALPREAHATVEVHKGRVRARHRGGVRCKAGQVVRGRGRARRGDGRVRGVGGGQRKRREHRVGPPLA